MNAANRYIARLYEEAIARELDLTRIRSYLASRGVIRSTFQVKADLDSVYCFADYSASHQPPPAQCVRAFDRAIDQGRG